MAGIELLIFLLFGFWAVRQVKAVLFWVYLWQLKDYLWTRFLDHFRTEDGKRLLFGKLNVFKIAIFAFMAGEFVVPAFASFRFFLLSLLLVLYVLEAGKTARDSAARALKAPRMTKKTFVLCVSSVIAIGGSAFVPFFSLPFRILFLDLATPLIVSFVVFLFEPIAVAERTRLVNRAASKRAGYKNLFVVGITGSYGKTSVKEFLAHILSAKFNVLKTAEHKNSEVGIAHTILEELKPEHEVFVCEMGAYKKGGIKLLADMAKPNIGILTGINEQHMATFGSQQAIIDTKFELIEALPDGGMAILNKDSACISQNAKVKIQKCKSKFKSIYCSAKEKMEAWAENIKADKKFVEFRAQTREGESAEFRVNVLGVHNIQNILLAAAAARELGMTLRDIAKACSTITPAIGAMQLRKGIGGAVLIDSSYSANPDGVLSDLEYLKLWQGKKIIIMPCLIELGKASKEVHERIGRAIAIVCDFAIITTKERFDDVKRGAMAQGMRTENILFMDHGAHILETIYKSIQPGDAILVEGRVQKEIINALVGV